jgi:vacuolar-type H+-ATPase subunit I/STV1
MRLRLGLAGLAGGALWTALAFFPPEDEVVRNRLWTPALFGMWLGVLGVFLAWRPVVSRVGVLALKAVVVGLGLMTLGNLVEYWFLSGYSHDEGGGAVARGLAWMTVLLGALGVAVGSAVAGSSMLKTADVPRFVGLVCLLVVPLTVVGAFVDPGLAAIPIACLASVALVWASRAQPSSVACEPSA